MPWPTNWEALRSGRDCPACQEGRPDEADGRLRVFSGRLVDAYLNRDDAARGYVLAFFRGRHVCEVTELSEEEAAGFWRELLQVARAVEREFRPVKLNLLLLGNAMPHLHAHIVPRYRDDSDAGGPPRFMMGWSEWQNLDDAAYLADVERLRKALSDDVRGKPPPS